MCLALLIEYATKPSAVAMMRIINKMAPKILASTVAVLMLAESPRITSHSVSVITPNLSIKFKFNVQYKMGKRAWHTPN